jgi:broad specificity phosphatase PhoE
MMETRFWLIRHAIVAKNELDRVYGIKDVPICPDHLAGQTPVYRALAARLPRPAKWFCSPLQRTRHTAEAIFAAGYETQTLTVEAGIIEQNMGALQGLERGAVAGRLAIPAHPFWVLSHAEVPEGGESVEHLLARVGDTLERLAREHEGHDVVLVSHGGVIRAAIGHAMGVGALPILHLSVQNLSLTRLDHLDEGWRVGWINLLYG